MIYDFPYLCVRVCVCVFVCFLPIYSGRQVRWMYQPGSHRRKVTQESSSTFLRLWIMMMTLIFCNTVVKGNKSKVLVFKRLAVTYDTSFFSPGDGDGSYLRPLDPFPEAK